jgi:hypothetical protein
MENGATTSSLNGHYPCRSAECRKIFKDDFEFDDVIMEEDRMKSYMMMLKSWNLETRVNKGERKLKKKINQHQ